MELKDRVILITGAARGIGRATAILAVREGARVVVNYNTSKKEAEDVVAEIKKFGGQGLVIKADVADRQQLKIMVDKIIREWGRIDVLINNAGIFVWKDLFQQTPEEIDREIDVNFRGLVHLTRLVLPIMQKQKDGVIVNISSGLGKRGMANAAVYCATKFAVLGFTQSLAGEIEKDNIRVYAVCPGQTATEMGDYAGMPAEKVAKRIIQCAKEELDLHTGEDTEIYG